MVFMVSLMRNGEALVKCCMLVMDQRLSQVVRGVGKAPFGSEFGCRPERPEARNEKRSESDRIRSDQIECE